MSMVSIIKGEAKSGVTSYLCRLIKESECSVGLLCEDLRFRQVFETSPDVSILRSLSDMSAFLMDDRIQNKLIVIDSLNMLCSSSIKSLTTLIRNHNAKADFFISFQTGANGTLNDKIKVFLSSLNNPSLRVDMYEIIVDRAGESSIHSLYLNGKPVGDITDVVKNGLIAEYCNVE